MKNIIRFLTLLIVTTIISACNKPDAPSNVYGILHIDKQTDWVFLNEETSIGGPCFGWSKVSIQAPNAESGDTSQYCWKTEGGLFVTNTVAGNRKELPIRTVRAFFNKYPQHMQE